MRRLLTNAGVTDLRTTPGFENDVTTAVEGTWRNHLVLAYVTPTVHR